jgi:hypothetical protein
MLTDLWKDDKIKSSLTFLCAKRANSFVWNEKMYIRASFC